MPQVRNRADLSHFLVHLTKNGDYEDLRVFHGDPSVYEKVNCTVEAKGALEKIIADLKIKAYSSFGYFKMKINMYRPCWDRIFNNGDADPNWMQAVCFSEAPLSELNTFCKLAKSKKNQYQKYGLAFHQDKVIDSGGNPVLYFSSKNKAFKNTLDSLYEKNRDDIKSMMHLFEGFGPPFLPTGGYSDFRWEREWRLKGGFQFKLKDIAFGICPSDEIQYFTEKCKDQVIFLDPDWEQEELKNYLTIHKPTLLDEL